MTVAAATQHNMIVITEPYSVIDPDPSSVLVGVRVGVGVGVGVVVGVGLVTVAQLSVCSRGASTVIGSAGTFPYSLF